VYPVLEGKVELQVLAPSGWRPRGWVYRGRDVQIRPLATHTICFSKKRQQVEDNLSTILIAFNLFLSFFFANTISVITGTGYLPASVRAAF
jgi:hypothetical protein